MKRIIATVTVVLSIAGTVFANDLATYKATYEKKMETIILSHGMQMAELSQKYTDSLDTLLSRVKKAGDLNNTTAVMEEIARFAVDKAMPTTPSALLDIQNLQSLFTKQASSHEVNKAKEVILLTAKYDKALERLQRSLVSSSKLDNAKVVQEERKRVATSESVTQATLALRKMSASSSPTTQLHKETERAHIPGNLLKNSGNEMHAQPGEIPEWNVVAGNTWTHRTDNPSPKDGTSYFSAGASKDAELQQDVDVSSYRAEIFRGRQKFRFDGYVSSWKTAMDTSRIIVEFLDKSKRRVLDSYDSGERKSAMTWKRITHEQVAPRSTFFIRVRLIARRHDGKNNDGYFDALSLKAVKTSRMIRN